MDRSGSTWSPLPSARIRRERCGWVVASSSVMRPSSTRRCTQVWSCVICVRTPSRRRYARESPTCTRPRRWPVQRRAVRVVPMPSSWGSSSTIERSWSLARCTAVPSEVRMSEPGTSSSSATIVEMASEEATSPAAAPPMPSAMASRRGPAYPESSLPSRIIPLCDPAAKRSDRLMRTSPVGSGYSRSCRATLPTLRSGARRGPGWGPPLRARSARSLSYYFRSSMTVLPMRIGAPSAIGVGVVSRFRSRYVPLVEPRSSTIHWPSRSG
ncbi:hypothetical protein QFZ43_004417 [Streptomyces afghaniensis]|nr:hypothetical protein [Streptomyces afghaniensis]